MKIAFKNGQIIEIVPDGGRLRTIDTGWTELWAPNDFKWKTPIENEEPDGTVSVRYRLSIGDPDPTDDIDPVVLQAHVDELAAQAAKAQAFLDNLPSWTAVSNAVDNIGNLAEAKVFLKKMARVIYWLVKNSED